jgi:hypothetical protein
VRAADEERFGAAVVVVDIDFEGLRTFMFRPPLVGR